MIRQNSVVLSIRHDDIAKNIGSVREIVTKILKQMSQNKIIKSGYGKIEILNKEKLHKMI